MSEEEAECTNWARLSAVVRERIESQRARSKEIGAPTFVIVEGFRALQDNELTKEFDHVFHLFISTDRMSNRRAAAHTADKPNPNQKSEE